MLTVKTRKEIFMRKQRLARIGAATLAAVLTVQGMGFSSTVYAKEEPVRVKADLLDTDEFRTGGVAEGLRQHLCQNTKTGQ